MAKIYFSYENVFIIEVCKNISTTMNIVLYIISSVQEEEFSRVAETSHYNLFRGNQVFVIWNWTWLDAVDCALCSSEDVDTPHNDCGMLQCKTLVNVLWYFVFCNNT